MDCLIEPTKESNWSLRQTNSRPLMLSVEKTEMSLGLKMTFSAVQTKEMGMSHTKHFNGAAWTRH